MTVFTGTAGGDSADAGTGLLTGFTGGSLALLQDSIGDSFTGLEGADQVSAGAGNDTLSGGLGADTLFGGNGDDLFLLESGAFVAGDVINGGIGTDTIGVASGVSVNLSLGSVTSIESLIGDIGNESITMSAAQFAVFASINAGSGTDTVTALFSGTADLTTGPSPVLGGIERLAFTGGAGDDTLILTAAMFDAANAIDFGAGNDTLVLLNTSSVFSWQPIVPNAGLNNLENVTVIDSEAGNSLTFSPSTRNFNVAGNGGNDSITTYNGNDTIAGGAGNDIIVAAGGTDTAVYAGPVSNFSAVLNTDGTYTLTDTTGTEGIDTLSGVEFLTFAGVTYSINSIVPPPTTTFTGTSGSDVADAIAGTLSGFSGGTVALLQDIFGDVFLGSTGNDTISGGSGGDTIIGGAGADYLLGNPGEDLFIFNTGDAEAGEYVHGDTGLDTIQATGNVNFFGSQIIHIGGLVTTNTGADITIQNDHDFAYFQGGTGFDRITIMFGTGVTYENISSTEMTITGIEELRIIDTVGASNSIVCSDMNEYIDGGAGNDTISGRNGDDTAIGGAGDDQINCGDGTGDLVIYTGARANFTVTASGSAYIVTDNVGNQGSDTIRNVEFVKFGNVTYAIANILNAPATIGGTVSGGVTEDTALTTGGNLTITDPNPGEAAFQTTPVTGPSYGAFSITAAGQWTYNLSNGLAAVQSLKAGATLQDVITVASLDGTTQQITVTITGTNDAPVVSAPVPDQPATVGAAFSYTVPAATFSDVDSGDTRVLSAKLASGAGLPAWLVFNATTGQFSGTPGAGDTGALNLRVTYTDGAGASVSDDFTLNISGVTVNNPPVFTSPASASVKENSSSIVLDVNATDPEGATVAYSLTGVDAGLFTIDANGVIRFVTSPDFEAPADAGANNVYNVTANASDGPNTASQNLTITVTDEEFVISGSGALNGSNEEDTISGQSGADSIRGLAGNDVLNGNNGADTLEGGTGADTLNGGNGNDFASYFEDASGASINLTTAVFGGSAAGDKFNSIEYVSGSNTGNDTITGSSAADRILGNGGNDLLDGDAGRDTLEGGAGNDTLNGNGGQDTMTGGAGVDIFDFNGTSGSGTGANKRDSISDFAFNVDRIDLFDIDARAGTAGNQDFTFIGTAAFSAEGQVRVLQSGADTILEVNTSGTGNTEMEVLLTGVNASSLDQFDFIL